MAPWPRPPACIPTGCTSAAPIAPSARWSSTALRPPLSSSTARNAIGNTVSGCYLGIDPSGISVVRMVFLHLSSRLEPAGIPIGGVTAAARNIISGSAYQGLSSKTRETEQRGGGKLHRLDRYRRRRAAKHLGRPENFWRRPIKHHRRSHARRPQYHFRQFIAGDCD